MRGSASVLVVVVLAGCTTYKSNIVTQDQYGNVQTTPISGVPIVVTVPQKLAFLVTENTYLIEEPVVVNDQVTDIRRYYAKEVQVDKTPISLGASQLVALDIKRPIFGTAKTSMELENQYPTKLTAEIDDKTLGRLLDSADKLAEQLIEKQGAVSANATRTLFSQRQYLIVYDPSTQALSTMALGGSA